MVKKYSRMSRPLRIFYSVLGVGTLILGSIGLILPIMPSVPFLLVSSWCFSRSSPNFHRWLHNHRIFGPPIKKWEENRAISPFLKVVAVVSMLCCFLSFLIIVGPAFWFAVLILIIMSAVAVYIITRPS
ncbi:YbaN family protein [Bartonella ancashensis]|uniref:Heme utilization-like protein n=1 Tax=Bartonella ancashensis TaxID=1318743 RepID=A0A0M4LG59_9HYPH|nr:YbaN family protein [Bartonella ancashensis]ALE03344.1 heme utilization-like protein [Bartonella ancashensis]